MAGYETSMSVIYPTTEGLAAWTLNAVRNAVCRSIQLGRVIIELKRVLLLIVAACQVLTENGQAHTAVARPKGGLALCLALYVIGLSTTAHAQTITVFDAPGAGTGPGQGTYGIAIHPTGAITGIDIDPGGVIHGFLHAAGGGFTTFDAPGAGTGPGQGTNAESINPAREIAGEYLDTGVCITASCALQMAQIIVFEVPAAGTGTGQGTFVATVSGITRERGSLDTTLTAAMWHTATCALPTASSPLSTLRVQAPANSKALMLEASTRRVWPRSSTKTQAVYVTGTCMLLTAPSPLSTHRAQAQAPAKVPRQRTSTRRGRSPDG